MTRDQFLVKWRTRLDELQRLDATVNGAKLCGEVLADFEAVATAEDEALLILPEAASRSGYSAEHLGRMIREGRIPNAGRKGAPRIRTADLPRKPPALVPAGPRAYDPGADARTLLNRQRGGSDG